jgi:hypothetical protein
VAPCRAGSVTPARGPVTRSGWECQPRKRPCQPRKRPCQPRK